MNVVSRQLASYLTAMLLVLAALLGPWMLVSMSMDQGHMGCPFMQGQATLCPMAVFDHLEHWQSAFATTLVEIISFAVVATFTGLWRIPLSQNAWLPPPTRKVSRPTLLEELFSQGLLHPRAP